VQLTHFMHILVNLQEILISITTQQHYVMTDKASRKTYGLNMAWYQELYT
jgi:hypothetical protein